MPVIACAEHMLTMVMAMARRVGRCADGKVVEISTIHAGHMLPILNVIKMSAYAQNILESCLGYSGDAVGVGVRTN